MVLFSCVISTIMVLFSYIMVLFSSIIVLFSSILVCSSHPLWPSYIFAVQKLPIVLTCEVKTGTAALASIYIICMNTLDHLTMTQCIIQSLTQPQTTNLQSMQNSLQGAVCGFFTGMPMPQACTAHVFIAFFVLDICDRFSIQPYLSVSTYNALFHPFILIRSHTYTHTYT